MSGAPGAHIVTQSGLLLKPVAVSVRCFLVSFPLRSGGATQLAETRAILANGERLLSRVENLLLMLDWAVAGSLIPLDSRGLAVPESFAKRVFALILC